MTAIIQQHCIRLKSQVKQAFHSGAEKAGRIYQEGQYLAGEALETSKKAAKFGASTLAVLASVSPYGAAFNLGCAARLLIPEPVVDQSIEKASTLKNMALATGAGAAAYGASKVAVAILPKSLLSMASPIKSILGTTASFAGSGFVAGHFLAKKAEAYDGKVEMKGSSWKMTAKKTLAYSGRTFAALSLLINPLATAAGFVIGQVPNYIKQQEQSTESAKKIDQAARLSCVTLGLATMAFTPLLAASLGGAYLSNLVWDGGKRREQAESVTF